MGVSIWEGKKAQELSEAAQTFVGDGIDRLCDAILGGTGDLTDYRAIIRAIRNGKIDRIPNGLEFVVPHAVYGNVHFVTMRKNVDKVLGDEERPTLTIKVKYALSDGGGATAATFVYDKPEAFAEAEIAYAADTRFRFEIETTYSKWYAGKYIFVPPIAIQPGYRFCINGYADGELGTARKVTIYENATATTALATVDIIADDEGEAVGLGTFGKELNHAQRVSYGSNNGAESNIRQWLNGKGLMSDIFVPQTKFDMMAPMYANMQGFLGGFPDDFIECLAPCKVHNVSNTVYECTTPAEAYSSSKSYAVGDILTYEGWVWRCITAHASGNWTESHFTKIAKHYGIEKDSEYWQEGDYFWLASRKEVYGSNETASEESDTQFPYYAEVATTNHDKLLFANGATSAVTDWEREHYYGGV